MTTDERIDAVYALVPGIACRRLCAPYCGPIPSTHTERRRLRRAGHPLGHDDVQLRCNLLTHDGLCSAHSLRPLICRLWGVVQGMRCPWGCQAERILTRDESTALFAELCRRVGEDFEAVTREMGRELERLVNQRGGQVPAWLAPDQA